jgi:hypothetical protein
MKRFLSRFRTLLARGSVREPGNVNHDQRFVFIHIPKCAGTSLSHALGIERSTHSTYRQYAGILGDAVGDYFVFTIVRNPWARFLSLYDYARMTRSHYHDAVDPKKALYGKHLDYELLKDASLAECARFLVEGRLRHDRAWNHWRPQSTWLQDDRGEVEVDFVGRVEEMEVAVAEISARLGLSLEVPRLNVSGESRGYRDAYDGETRRIVERHYAEDIERFGYTY